MYEKPGKRVLPSVSIVPIPTAPENSRKMVGGVFRSEGDPRLSESAGIQLIERVHEAMLSSGLSFNAYGRQRLSRSELPPDYFMAAMALKESSWNPFAKGGVGERGMFQLRPGTAKELWNEAGGVPAGVLSLANSFVDNLPEEHRKALARAGIRLSRVNAGAGFDANHLYNPVINTYLATLNNVKNLRWTAKYSYKNNPLVKSIERSLQKELGANLSRYSGEMEPSRFIAVAIAYNGGRFSVESAEQKNPSQRYQRNVETYAKYMLKHARHYQQTMVSGVQKG